MKKNTILFLLFLYMSPLFSSQKLIFSSVQNSVIGQVTQQIMTEAYHRLGIELSVYYHPAKRSLALANAGESYDGELHRIAGIENEYLNLRMVPVPIYHLEGVAISYKKDFKMEGWKSLEPYKIGVRRGIVFAVTGTEGMNRIILNTNEHLFKMLSAQRIDFIVMTRLNALKQLETKQYPTLKILEPPVEVKKLYHYLHKKNSHLIPKLTSILKDMQNEGVIQKIKNDYIKTLLIK